MALKPVYEIEGRRWLPLARAAALLATNTSTVKLMLGDGRLEWRQLRPGSTTFLVAEADVLAQRHARGTIRKEVARRSRQSTQSAMTRGKAMLPSWPPPQAGGDGRNFGVYVPTWDPAPCPPRTNVSAHDDDER